MTTSRRNPHDVPLPSVDSLDLALASQRLEAELRDQVVALLPLLENVEKLCRGLERATAEELAQRAEGLALLADLADKAASAIGLQRIGAVGEAADGSRHLVIDTAPGQGQPPGAVLEVVQYGWVFQGRVLRPAKVVAAEGRPGAAAPGY
jgi:molecular chaperone GrpE